VTYESNIIYMTAAAKALGGANNALGIGVSVESVGYTVSGLNFYNNIVVNNLAGFWAFKTESGHTYSGWLVAGNTFINNDRGIRVDNSGGTVADNIFENNVLINANLGDNAILFDTDSGGNIFRNNLYWGGTEQFNWLGSSTNFAGWVTNSGETNSSWTNPFLADYTTVPPSFWEAIRLGLIADPDAGAILDVGTSSDTTTSSGTSSSSTSSGDVSAQTVSKKGQGKTKR